MTMNLTTLYKSADPGDTIPSPPPSEADPLADVDTLPPEAGVPAWAVDLFALDLDEEDLPKAGSRK